MTSKSTPSVQFQCSFSQSFSVKVLLRTVGGYECLDKYRVCSSIDNMKCYILCLLWCTMWVASPWGFSEMTIQPARHECHACCLLWAGFLSFQPVVDNTRDTRAEQVVSSFHHKILRGSQLTWYRSSPVLSDSSRKLDGSSRLRLRWQPRGALVKRGTGQ